MTDDWSLDGKIGLHEGCDIDEGGSLQVYEKKYIETLRQKLIEDIKTHVEEIKKAGLGNSSYYSACYAMIPIIDKRFGVK